MQVQESFEVAAPLDAVWGFFEQVERVARYVPGVTRADVLAPDRYKVVASQKVGFIWATFELTTEIAGKQAGAFMEFSSVGKRVAPVRWATWHRRHRRQHERPPAAVAPSWVPVNVT